MVSKQTTITGTDRAPMVSEATDIDAHRHDVVDGRGAGGEPICAVLKKAGVQIAPSRYHCAAKTGSIQDTAQLHLRSASLRSGS